MQAGVGRRHPLVFDLPKVALTDQVPQVTTADIADSFASFAPNCGESAQLVKQRIAIPQNYTLRQDQLSITW